MNILSLLLNALDFYVPMKQHHCIEILAENMHQCEDLESRVLSNRRFLENSKYLKISKIFPTYTLQT